MGFLELGHKVENLLGALLNADSQARGAFNQELRWSEENKGD